MRDNFVSITGKAMEPELRFTASGIAMCTFSVALYEGKNDDGSYKDSSFIDCVAWRELAEHVAESVVKGNRINVVGRLTQRKWETDDGQKRSKVQVVADEVHISMRWGPAKSLEPTNTSSSGYGGGGAAANVPDEDPFL